MRAEKRAVLFGKAFESARYSEPVLNTNGVQELGEMKYVGCFFTPIHSEIDLLYYPEKQAMRALSVEITTVSLKKSRAFDATK
jgi:hypothetical protein